MAKVNFWYGGELRFAPNTFDTPNAIYTYLINNGDKVNHVAQMGYSASEWMPCDYAIIYGMRGRSHDIVQDHKRRGIPVICVDLGYLNRASKANKYQGYWQVSLNGLNWLPPKGDNTRFDALGLKRPKQKSKKTGYCLICAQVNNDGSHGMPDTMVWVREAERKCKALGIPYKTRLHPMMQGGATNPLEDDLKGVRFVYVHNSNTGNDAIMYGLPVVHDDGARYAPTYNGFCSTDLNAPKYPDDVNEYLNRLAYGQWTREEILSGEAIRHALANK